MPLIKRYPNRKLYDTEAKQYVTLDGIAALIRQGQDVQVVDYGSGEDLTTLTLAQVILERERARSSGLPKSVLTGLIQAGGDTLQALRHALADSLDLARQVDEEIERRVQELATRGEVALEEMRHLRRLLGSGQRSGSPLSPTEEQIGQRLLALGMPTREDLTRVLEQLDNLEAILDGAGRL